MTEPVRQLDYAGDLEPDTLACDVRPDGGVTITVPTRRRSFKNALTMCLTRPAGVVLLPVVWVLVTTLASRKPRAILRLTREEFVLTETADEGFGYSTSSRVWPRSAIGELRANRYANTLYLRVPDKESLDLLPGLPPSWIQEISRVLEEAEIRLRDTPAV